MCSENASRSLVVKEQPVNTYGQKYTREFVRADWAMLSRWENVPGGRPMAAALCWIKDRAEPVSGWAGLVMCSSAGKALSARRSIDKTRWIKRVFRR